MAKDLSRRPEPPTKKPRNRRRSSLPLLFYLIEDRTTPMRQAHRLVCRALSCCAPRWLTPYLRAPWIFKRADDRRGLTHHPSSFRISVDFFWLPQKIKG
ncbi:unnamed protein product [Amoebophrya sp. A120]|nr:unnamed protein product [Amoebophrya sp. A120]|eukprot:GSA120T00012019001.1